MPFKDRGGVPGDMRMTNWKASGLSKDLPPANVMHADWQGVDLAVWRSASGRLSAWVDRCPHRGMRLSHGFVRGETLACIYHGWTYGVTGACTHIPAHPDMTPPATITATRFEVTERGGVIWIAAKDDPTAPPDIAGFQPLRSLTVQVGEQALLQALAADAPGLTEAEGGLRGTVQIAGLDTQICLMLQPKAQETTLHILCGAGAGPAQVSRWAESLRRQIEDRSAP